VRRLQSGGVIDSSVAVKPVLLDEDLVDVAIAVLATAARGPSHLWAMPDLFDVECANVVRRAVLRGRLGVGQAGRALRLLLEVPGRRVAGTLLAEAALMVALERSISVYDACYVALASLLGVPLVTADERLASALEGSAHKVVRLREIDV
jgi:predicted nucleic acid-binding protein